MGTVVGPVNTRRNGVTGTVVHAPPTYEDGFESPAAWDTGACHPTFFRYD
jgi:hypothetical protein